MSIALLAVGLVSKVSADSVALNFASLGTGLNYHQGSYSLGWRFTANQTITVSGLGYYDSLQDGLVESHDVGIFDQGNCQLLASATVTPADQITGFFRFHSITPVILTAGHDYYIAGVTGTEQYGINVQDLIVDPSITFWGFAIYGNTQSTSTLQCPNGPANAQGIHGDFGPSFKISNSSSGGAAAISLFCNRSGVNLTALDCSVTVGDTNPPPRTTPTGTVNFTATGGILPGSGSCTLQQTPYSPGVASCSAQFTLPIDFPIGVAFPIDATYLGDSTFSSVSTSHSLIQAGCIGDPGNPCLGAVGLTFADLPQVLKNSISTIFECGNAKAAHAHVQASSFQTAAGGGLGGGISGIISQCVGGITVNLPLANILAGMDQSQIQTLIGDISKKDAQNDTILGAVKALGDSKNAADLQNALNKQTEMLQLLQKLIDQQVNLQHGVIHNLRYLTLNARHKLTTIVQIGAADVKVKNNSRKVVKVRLTKLGARLAKLLKLAGKGDVDLSFSVKGKRANGRKYPFNSKQTINVGLS